MCALNSIIGAVLGIFIAYWLLEFRDWIMRLHFKIVIGRWMFSDWHLYRYTFHCSVKRPAELYWMNWDKIV